MEELHEILDLMRAFRDDAIEPAEFVRRYSSLWHDLVQEQDAAIARHPTVGPALQELREQYNHTEISTERYSQRVGEQYALLEGLRLRPGSEESRLLGHVFVEADAYRADEGERGDVYIGADALRAEVRHALETLKAA